MGGDSRSKGRGFESRHRILDGHDIFSHWFAVKLYCLFEKTENKRKRGRGLPFFFLKKKKKKIGQALGHFLMTYLHIYDTLPATFCANFVSLTYGFRATFFKQKLPKLDSEFPILCFKFKNSMKNWKKKDSCIHQINHDKLRSCAWDSNPGRKELKDPLSYYGPLLESNTY